MGAPNQRGENAFQFCWLGTGSIPSAFDLRRSGWILKDGCTPSSGCIGLIDAGNLDNVAWGRVLSAYSEETRHYILATSVKRASERAMLLEYGFGDAVSDTITIEELRARASRTAEFTHWLPRQRQFGTLQLDLLAREAYADAKPLNLNPREFGLLWRLADNPNCPVSKQMLIHDVWRMGFVPETNSIAVHMSRLRRKLAIGGLRGVIETASEGGYCLRIPEPEGKHAFKPEQSTGRTPGLALNGMSLPV